MFTPGRGQRRRDDILYCRSRYVSTTGTKLASDSTYFVLSASMPKEPIWYQWRTKWPLFEFVVEKQTGETIGIEYRAVS